MTDLRPLRIVLLLSWGLICSPMAAAQSVAFDDDFTCGDHDSFGEPQGVYGWSALVAGDPWSTSFIGGVSPLTDEGAGTFGAPIDHYENFLVTGHSTWTDVSISATVRNGDNDMLGLTVRANAPDSFYSCVMSNDQIPDCNGNGQGGLPEAVRIVRVDSAVACVSDNVVASQPFTYARDTDYGMSFQILGDTLWCRVDTNNDGDFTDAADIEVSYVDPAPLPSGLAGLVSYNNGDEDGSLAFDDVVVLGFDPDSDGDGLSDLVEADLGSNASQVDTDGSGISDRHEAVKATLRYGGSAASMAAVQITRIPKKTTVDPTSAP